MWQAYFQGLFYLKLIKTDIWMLQTVWEMSISCPFEWVIRHFISIWKSNERRELNQRKTSKADRHFYYLLGKFNPKFFLPYDLSLSLSLIMYVYFFALRIDGGSGFWLNFMASGVWFWGFWYDFGGLEFCIPIWGFRVLIRLLGSKKLHVAVVGDGGVEAVVVVIICCYCWYRSKKKKFNVAIVGAIDVVIIVVGDRGV